MNLTRLRWLTVLVPLVFLALVDYARYALWPQLLNSASGTVLNFAIVVIGTYFFSRSVFDYVEAIQAKLADQQRALEETNQVTHRQAAQLHALHIAGLFMVSNLSLDALLQQVVEQACDLVGARYGALGVLLEIELRQADLVVMCTHGRSGLGRWFYGSVTDGVLAKSPVPILLVRPTGPLESLALEWGRPHLLVPLDGSVFAESALPYATALARDLNATIVLVRAVVPPAPPAADITLSTALITEEAIKEERHEAEEYLADIAHQLGQQGLRIQTVVRIEGAAGAILDEGLSVGAGLIMMAMQSRTGLGRLIFGSVALGVLQHGLLPLLLVRPGGLARPQTAVPVNSLRQVTQPANG